jgi:hypothetical protein
VCVGFFFLYVYVAGLDEGSVHMFTLVRNTVCSSLELANSRMCTRNENSAA